MKSIVAAVAWCTLSGSQMAWAQTPADCTPSSLNIPEAKYPCVYPDHRAMFRVVAPNAAKVRIRVGPGFDMQKGPDGIWDVTTTPLVEGFHYYTVQIDGAVVADPSTMAFFGSGWWNSGIEIPASERDFYAAKDVPHGRVAQQHYYSTVTHQWRRAYIYTPPDYDSKARNSYPVLYLLHGWGEDETGWYRQGHVDLIVDNLIAAGKAKPMIIVMDNLNAVKPGESAAIFGARGQVPPPSDAPPPAPGSSAARYLAVNLDMDRHIHEIAAVCDYVQGLRKSSKRLWLSFDEWNVWYRARDRQATDGRRATAPKLLEEVYNLEDALLVGGLLNTLLRNSDRVHVACLAQLVNVIAPLVTHEHGVLRQSTYYPYAWALRYARGRVLDLRVESETHPIRASGLQADFARNADVPFVDVVATLDEANGQACVLMLNRDVDAEREVVLQWEDVTPARVLACETITGPDLKAFNTIEQPGRVIPQRLEPPRPASRMTCKLPARSYTVAQLAVAVRSNV
jgi:hypothetical protein